MDGAFNGSPRWIGTLAITAAGFVAAVWLFAAWPDQQRRAIRVAPSFHPPLPKNVTYATADNVYPSDQNYYNVRNYGAKGDGVADDTTAIQAAMAAALARTGQPNHGGVNNTTVYFPAGTYKISQPLMWWQIPSDAAIITASLDTSRGCITGFNVVHSGSGYWMNYDTIQGNPAIGLWVTGGGGSGVVLQSGSRTSSDGVAGINMYGATCIGQGFTSAPKVQAVSWQPRLRFEGQNKSNTTILLADNTPGFTNSNCSISVNEGLPRQNCQAVIYTAGNTANANGTGEDAYYNDIWNLTINTGHGNAGAVGLDWMASNRGSIKNVNIVSGDGKGRSGLNLSRNDWYGGGGPALIKNVSVRGFDIGIDNNSSIAEVGYTFEYIDLENQNQFGVINGGYSAWFREVSSTNAVPVFVNCMPGVANENCGGKGGSLTVVDGTFTGGSPNNSAVLVQNDTVGAAVAFLRNIQTSGYGSALATSTSNTPVGGSTISEWSFPAPVSLFSSTPTSLNLQNMPDTPEFVDNNFNDWADVSTFGSECEPNTWEDGAGCIQAALNSGRPVIFFPFGQYNISSTLYIPSSVRKIIGSASTIYAVNSGTLPGPIFSVNSNSGNFVEIQNLLVATKSGISQSGSSPLVLSDVWDGSGYLSNTSSGTGDIYLEDFPWAGINVTQNGSQHLYCRQCDIEGAGIVDNGGTLWVFGYKTEGTRTLLNIANANAEILGEWSNSNSGHQPVIAFSATNSQFSLAGIALAEGWDGGLVQEIQGSATMTLGQNRNWHAGNGIGLYSGHK